MRKIIFIVAVAVFALSCKETIKETAPATQEVVLNQEVSSTISKEYPKDIASVFKAHGGVDLWKNMNQLAFTLGEERHTVDLKSRKTTIQTDKFTLGFNGEKVWLAQDSAYFQAQRARFYHNLMFYFYAMPFVVSDDGIAYSDAKSLEFEGVSYPGTKISFGNDVGDAPDDEYIIYRHPETNQMEWLAFTVTYGRNEKSDNFNYIKYDQWTEVEGLQLPSTIHYYKAENGVPTEKTRERVFTNPIVSSKIVPATLFEKPEGAKFAE